MEAPVRLHLAQVPSCGGGEQGSVPEAKGCIGTCIGGRGYVFVWRRRV